MKCPNCRREMTPLLFSCVCDFCDGLRPLDAPFVGYVVWSDEYTAPARAYVFAKEEFAQRWRSLRGPRSGVVRKVASSHPFRWRSGVQTTSDLVFADTLVEVYPDKSFEPAPHRAYLS